ncbi:MAG: RagB/SusD family nutrient uptake outer membrane protein [Balneolaceae bacterium]|nr:RagB/SusD family nutrient uptake outer membrane protein [Balneolaceae bacterium]
MPDSEQHIMNNVKKSMTMKNLKNIITCSGLIIVIVFTIYACDVTSFLDSPAQGTLSKDVLANEEGVEGNLASAYAMLDGYSPEVEGGAEPWPTAASNWVYGEVAADDAHMGAALWNPGIKATEFYQWSDATMDAQLNIKWKSLYGGINRANATLELLSEVEGISPVDRDRIKGEAQFLRAHYHFEAWKIWKNVPYITEADEDSEKTNIDVNVISKILSDLDGSINLLPQTQSEIGRVTKWTAKAYKGKVQVYSKDFDGALTTLRDVVNNGPYALEDNFWEVFSATNDNGSETVLAFQASVNDGDPQGLNGNYVDRLNFPHGGSPFGCCGVFMPSQNLVNAFKVDPSTGLPQAVVNPNNWNNDDDNFDADESAPVDPRLDWTTGRDGVPFLDWGKHEPGWIRARESDGPYSPKKNIYRKSTDASSSVGWANYQLHSKNLHLLRYADVLLLLAEAEIEASGGSLENARDIVNQIRTRASQAAQGPSDNVIVPINDPSITWANYQIGTYDTPWSSKEEARQAVRMERRLELAMEGHRLFDLRRWGEAQNILNNYVQKEKVRREYLTGADSYSDKHEVYPIPTLQVELGMIDGEQMIQQNPGW